MCDYTAQLRSCRVMHPGHQLGIVGPQSDEVCRRSITLGMMLGVITTVTALLWPWHAVVLLDTLIESPHSGPHVSERARFPICRTTRLLLPKEHNMSVS